MRKMGVGVLLALGLAFGLMFAASELGGEVVTLTTRGPDGAQYETSLWIVEDEGSLWLRAGNPESAWLKRLAEAPLVELRRGAEAVEYRAEIVRGRAERINQKMAEAYGWADRAIGGMRDEGMVTAVRLVPVQP